jgi:hypothetical protein
MADSTLARAKSNLMAKSAGLSKFGKDGRGRFSLTFRNVSGLRRSRSNLDNHTRCGECGFGLNIDTNRLTNAAEEMRSTPLKTTIKLFR